MCTGRAGLAAGSALLLAGMAWVVLPVPALGAQTPSFRYYGGPLRHALAIEVLAAHLEALAEAGSGSELQPAGGEGMAGAVKEAVKEYLPLLKGSLAAHSPELAGALEDELEAVVADAAAPGDADDGSKPRTAPALLDQARAVLVPGELGGAPDFLAILIATLLVSEGGVVGAVDDWAEGSPVAVYVASSLVRRVEALWPSLEAVRPPVDATFVEALEELRTFTSPGRSADSLPDPEAAEDVAYRAVAALEELTGVSLHPGRELPSIVALADSLASQACAEDPASPMGAERLAAARFLFREYLAAAVGTLEPELYDRLEELLKASASGRGSSHACSDLLSSMQQLAQLF